MIELRINPIFNPYPISVEPELTAEQKRAKTIEAMLGWLTPYYEQLLAGKGYRVPSMYSGGLYSTLKNEGHMEGITAERQAELKEQAKKLHTDELETKRHTDLSMRRAVAAELAKMEAGTEVDGVTSKFRALMAQEVVEGWAAQEKPLTHFLHV